jgi:hypothetical protein
MPEINYGIPPIDPVFNVELKKDKPKEPLVQSVEKPEKQNKEKDLEPNIVTAEHIDTRA